MRGLCVAKIYGCGIIKIERQPPTRWVAGFIVKRKSTLLLASFGVVFLCLGYGVAKIYECGIIKIERQPPTRWVADSKRKENPPRYRQVLGWFSYVWIIC